MSLKSTIVFLLFLNGWIQAQNPNTKQDVAIDSIVNQYLEKYSIVGMSIGIVNDGNSFIKNYGTTDGSKKYRITNQTQFHIASITKLFTTTAIMQLVEQNQLQLSDKLIDLLPNFKMKDKRHQQITIEHLLTHSTGLMWNHGMKNLPNDASAMQLFYKKLEKSKLKFTPGSKFSGDTYSDVNFYLLGEVIEKLTNNKYPDYIQEKVLAPAEIKNATFFYQQIDTANLALPQVVVGHSKKIKRFNQYHIDNPKNPIMNGQPLSLRNCEVYGELYIANAAGNLICNSSDLNKWISHHLAINNGQLENEKAVLELATLKNMWQIKKEIPNAKVGIGLGWWIFDNNELGRYVCHFGNNPGFCSMLFIFPEKNFGINILCNGWYAEDAIFNKIPLEIAKLYLKK